MITIKNNVTIMDRRQDRIPLFDGNSKNFPVTAWINFTEPRSCTYYCDTYLDQGTEGACVGFGMSHLLATVFTGTKVDNKFARETIYWEAQKTDPWEGGSYPGASPIYEGTAVLSGIKIAKSLGYFNNFRWSFNLQDMILGLGYHGPALLGVGWFDGMQQTDRKGFIHVTGQQTGGHCILCKGVNVEKKYFILHNSWGRDWGVDGDCYISFDDMEKLIKLNGEVAFILGKRKVS